MNSDSAFYIGKTHQVCQDYAAHGISTTGMPFAVISDGCSSSPDTDFGSRFLTKEAYRFLQASINLGTIQQIIPGPIGFFDCKVLDELLKFAIETNALTGLSGESLDATLLTVQKIQDRYVFVCAGDGVFAKIKKDGTIEVTQIEYDSGAPYYLSYQASLPRNKGYKEKFGLLRRVKTYSIVKGIPTPIVIKEDEDGSIFFEEGLVGDYVTLAVMSDGILSFMETIKTVTSKTNVSVEPYKVLNELLAFKSYAGVFVQRRFQRFRKDCEERGWFSVDDISIGAIHLEE